MLLLIGLLSSVLLQNLWSTLMMTSAQVVEASISTTDTSPSQDYPYLEDQTPTSKCHSPIRIINCISNIRIVLRFETAERLLLSSLHILNFPLLWVHPGPFIPDKELLIVYHGGGGGEGGGKGSDDFRPRRDLTGTKENYLSRTGREGDWNTTELHSYTATEPHRGSGKFYCQPTFLRTPLPPPATLIFNPSDKASNFSSQYHPGNKH